MKKLILGLAALACSASFAQAPQHLKIVNITYPEKTMDVTCLNDICSVMEIERPGEMRRRLNFNDIDIAIKNRGRQDSGLKPFEHTERSADNTRTSFEEGYYERSMANGLLTAGAAVLDVVLLPAVGIGELFVGHEYSVKQKRGAKRLKTNLLGGQKEMRLKHRWFEQIESFVRKAGYVTEVVVDEAIRAMATKDTLAIMDNMFVNCRIDAVDGYVQLYYNGHFAGNIPYETEMERLNLKVEYLMKNNVCEKISTYK